jgi:hypothetical protein
MFIEEGTTLADTAWVLTTNDSITVGGAAGTAMTFTQFAGAGVGISAISIATADYKALSSGGNSPVITLSTTLAGPVKSNGAGAFISQAIALGGAEVSGTLAVGNGGTGVSFTSGGLLRGNNVGALSVASAADIVAAIGATFVTNATNATNATNTVNVGVTNDAATATPVFYLG